MHVLRRGALTLASLCAMSALPAHAEWNVIRQKTQGADGDTVVAYTRNEDGYALEIYRDSVNAIRSRFTLRDGLLVLADRSCPTWQIDRNKATNRSVNEAPCLAHAQWAEYVLGYIEDSRVASQPLLSIMNGINITYRFRLQSGDYRETSFSLAGSKRALTEAVGTSVAVSAR